jgi:hypothetical protein
MARGVVQSRFPKRNMSSRPRWASARSVQTVSLSVGEQATSLGEGDWLVILRCATQGARGVPIAHAAALTEEDCRLVVAEVSTSRIYYFP